jgi:hypothetical protein
MPTIASNARTALHHRKNSLEPAGEISHSHKTLRCRGRLSSGMWIALPAFRRPFALGRRGNTQGIIYPPRPLGDPTPSGPFLSLDSAAAQELTQLRCALECI